MKAIALVLSLISFSAFADLTGSFSGTGAVSSDIGMSLVCESIHFDLTQNAQSFILKGSVKCGDQFDIEYDESTITIVNGRLFYQNQDVGSINADEVRLKYIETDENGQLMTLTTNFTKKGNVLQFEQGMATAQYSIFIKGDLK
ncbi:MAG: hypothetical protein ACOYL6_09260 [Bacteriovoracaceae bacterium]